MTNINTLIKDVYNVVGQESWFDSVDAGRYSTEMAARVMERLMDERQSSALRLSGMGSRCPRSLWASVHTPSVQEKFTPATKIKFHFGDVIEAMAIALAKAAGHDVKGEQDELELLGVKGHRDCVIDGCIVDVKSLSSLAFQKVKNQLVSEDVFLRSYLDQLDGYTVASYDDPIVTVKDRAYLWAVDKQMGHMCLYEHRIREDSIKERITSYKAIVARDQPPACTCGTLTEAGTGNVKLDLKASYNPYKYACFPNCRTFIIKGKPVHFAEVRRRPDGVEVDRNGSIVL